MAWAVSDLCRSTVLCVPESADCSALREPRVHAFGVAWGDRWELREARNWDPIARPRRPSMRDAGMRDIGYGFRLVVDSTLLRVLVQFDLVVVENETQTEQERHGGGAHRSMVNHFFS